MRLKGYELLYEVLAVGAALLADWEAEVARDKLADSDSQIASILIGL